MRSRLCAILLLASWTQAKAEEAQLPDPPGREVSVRMPLPDVGKQVHDLAIIIPDPSAPTDDEEEQPLAPPVMPIDLAGAVVKSENFDRCLFGEHTPEERRERMQAILELRVDDAIRWGHLPDQHRQKLMLAGRGDIKRFFDQVEDRRREFEKGRRNFRTGYSTLRRLKGLSQGYRDGPFGNGSLFAKTLQKIEADHETGL